MDHHRQPRHHHQPRQPPHQHQHQHQPRQQQHHHHHHPHIMNSPPPPSSPSSSRYLPLHPPPPPPPPRSFPENHPNLFQHPHPPPFHPDFTFHSSPPPPPHHPRDDHHHRDLIFRSPPRALPPNRLHPFDDNPNFPDDVVLDRPPRFRLNELPPPPPPPPPQQHPRVSPVSRRSPNQFVQFDRFGRQFDSPPPHPPPPPPPRFRQDLNDPIDYQLRRDRVEDDRRFMGAVDRIEPDFGRDWDRNRDRDHDRGRERERDHHDRYYPDMVMRNDFDLNSGNDEVLMRGGRGRDNIAGFQENVNNRYAAAGGGVREVSRSPIKFRIGGVEADDRFSNRGRKDDVQEYNVDNRGTPRKILQKKSAFLRIQQPGKPQHHHNSSFNGSSTSSFRNRFDNSTATPSPSHKGKESTSEFVDTRIGEEERVGSPVELDVSFKSNALVAKAIMAAPASTSGVDVNASNAVSDSGTRVVSESQAKVESLKTKSAAASKRDVKDSKSGARVSPIMKRVGESNKVEVRGSESSFGGSSSLPGGVTRKAAPKGKVLSKVEKNAGTDKVSSLNIRKKRKATGLSSRLSNSMPNSKKTGSGLVNVASSAGHLSEGSTPSDVSVKQSATELSLGGNDIGSIQNEYVDIGKVDINESPTVIGQEEIMGELNSEAPATTVIGQGGIVGEFDSEVPAKKMRKESKLEPLLDLTVSLHSGVSSDHGDAKGYSQDEQRVSNSDEDVSKLGKCHSDINFLEDSVQDHDMAAVLVDNCSVERSSELVRVNMVENVDNNDGFSGNVDTLVSVAGMSFNSNSVETEVDLLCPMVNADEPCETQDLLSPDNASIGLSLGGIYSDRNDEPGLRYSDDNSKVERLSNDANKHSETQAFSSLENVAIGLSLGGLYTDRNFESDLVHSEDNAKLGSFSNDASGDRRSPLNCDDVSIGLTNLNTVSDVRLTDDIQEQQYTGSDMSLNDDTTLEREEAPMTSIYAGGTLPFSVNEDNIVPSRKRKVGTEPNSLDLRMPDCCHEGLMNPSFSVENAMLPVDKSSSAAVGPPCVEPDVSKKIEYTESCVKGMNSLNHDCDLDHIENTSSCGKKRKNILASSVFSDALVSESSDLPAASGTLSSAADGSSTNHFPQSADGIELHKSVIAAEFVTGGASSSLSADRSSFVEVSKSDSVCKDLCLSVTESAPLDAGQSYLPEPGSNQKIGGNLMMAKANVENEFRVLNTACRSATYDGNIDLHCLSADHIENVDQGPLETNVEPGDDGTITNDGNSGLYNLSADHKGDVDQGSLAVNMEYDDNRMATNDGNSGLFCSSADHTMGDGQKSLAVNMECDDNIALNTILSPLPGCPNSCIESTYVGVPTNSDIMDTPSNVVLPVDCSRSSPTSDITNASPAIHVIAGEKLSMDDNKSKQSSATQNSFSSQANLLPESHKVNPKPGSSASSDVQSFTQKSVAFSLPLKTAKTSSAASSNSFSKLRRNVLTRSEVIPSTSQHTPVINPSNNTHAYPVKPRTWHRAKNSAASNIPAKKPPVGTRPPHRPLFGKALKVQDTSYIRKGNSLVRNPTSGASTSGSRALGADIDQSKPNGSYSTRKLVGSVTEMAELPESSVTVGPSAPIEMPKTPPLSCSGKTLDNDVVCLSECTSSLHIEQLEGADNEEAMKSSEIYLKDPEIVGNRNVEDPGIFSDGDLLGLSSKKMVYIKRKSNQLIAASKSSQLSVHNTGKTAALYSDNYYKRRRNQLIRASSDGNIQQMVKEIKDNPSSFSQRAPHVYTCKSSAKRPNKGKFPKLSLVWKLGDSKASGKGVDALRSRRLLSLLMPWKRATYWSRKSFSSRKRGAVYVRSGRGFSLRRSKVISLPGTSLKWSKSMEKRSKKVEEEASQAVSVQKSGSSGLSFKSASSIHSLHKATHSLKLHPGERIFRIGVFRYRMDPSRKTLQRISDDEASEFTASKTEKDARKTYVPKRLLIGSDEYVRIGNGNQLVRDPKRRTRILASEKVRWSLHTARMRLAKKRKFCQFFTRFGKCNKGEGKCPYVHDPSKIAVCTKFLNDLCVDPNCNLTHKVIPERMPDCSFYLQGLCSNEKCPYRHVNVNSKASICENFLRGYCAEGNECRKKHSYICPEFEACGSCPQGSKCKLYHPKKAKAKKRKVLGDQNNAKGRYFGSDLSVAVQPDETRPLVEKHVEPSTSKETFVDHGDLGDFISLDVDDEDDDDDDEAREIRLTASEQTFLSEDEPLNHRLNDLDELIKPLNILGTPLEKS